MERRAFLTAVFRGGRDRLAYTARAAAHFATSNPAWDPLVAQAAAAASHPLDQVANLAALAHWLQARLFEEARSAGGWGADRQAGFGEICSAPAKVAAKASRALGVDLSPKDLGAAASRNDKRHAKQPGAVFSEEAQAGADVQVEDAHGARIDAALAWAEQSLGS